MESIMGLRGLSLKPALLQSVDLEIVYATPQLHIDTFISKSRSGWCSTAIAVQGTDRRPENMTLGGGWVFPASIWPLWTFKALKVRSILCSTKAKNYLAINLHDETEESDDVPFSGMKCGTKCNICAKYRISVGFNFLSCFWQSSNHRSGAGMSFIEVEAIHLSQEVGGFGTGNMQGFDSRTLIWQS